MVKLLQREKIRVVFSEETFPAQMLKVLKDEGGVKVYIITHIASGDYTADKFEKDMQRNVDTMIRPVPGPNPGSHPTTRPARGKAGKNRSDCWPAAA